MRVTRWVLVLGLVGALGGCKSEERTFDETGGDGGSGDGDAGSGGEAGEGGSSGSGGSGGGSGSGGSAGASGSSGAGAEGGGGAGAEGGSGAAAGEGGSSGGGSGGSGGSSGSSGSGGSGGCDENPECDDANICNGEETCRTGECLRGTNADDGTPCTVAGETGNHFCSEGNCVASRCGDHVVDSDAEECDDGNTDDGDGCDNDCTFSCRAQDECDDGVFCNGQEACETHVCVPGEAEADGTPCGTDLACRQGECQQVGCGNGVHEPDHGEECDDGNSTEADGCDNDCTHSCEQDVDCSDDDVCTGTETCDSSKHVCQPGTPLECLDDDDCTENACNPAAGCEFPLIDEDGDGHASTALGTCGDDCDDGDDEVYEGATELCDSKDNDCDEDIDEVAPTWWVDCDGDTLALSNALTQKGCVEPPRSEKCPDASAGRWTTTEPIDASTTDCWDADPDVHPYPPSDTTAFHTEPIVGRGAAVDFDYNCDTKEEARFTSKAGACTTIRTGCTGSGWVDGTVPACGAVAEKYRACIKLTTTCVGTEVQKKQECR